MAVLSVIGFVAAIALRRMNAQAIARMQAQQAQA